MEPMEIQPIIDAVMGRLFVELEASGRHVHVTKEQAQVLFGHGLTPKRPLSQPGQFLANERVTVLGPKGANITEIKIVSVRIAAFNWSSFTIPYSSTSR